MPRFREGNIIRVIRSPTKRVSYSCPQSVLTIMSLSCTNVLGCSKCSCSDWSWSITTSVKWQSLAFLAGGWKYCSVISYTHADPVCPEATQHLDISARKQLLLTSRFPCTCLHHVPAPTQPLELIPGAVVDPHGSTGSRQEVRQRTTQRIWSIFTK